MRHRSLIDLTLVRHLLFIPSSCTYLMMTFVCYISWSIQGYTTYAYGNASRHSSPQRLSWLVDSFLVVFANGIGSSVKVKVLCAVLVCAVTWSWSSISSRFMQTVNEVCGAGKTVDLSMLFSWLICLIGIVGGQFPLIYYKYFFDGKLAKFLSSNCETHSLGRYKYPWIQQQVHVETCCRLFQNISMCPVSSVFLPDRLSSGNHIHRPRGHHFFKFSLCHYSLFTSMEASEDRIHWVNFNHAFDESVLKDWI